MEPGSQIVGVVARLEPEKGHPTLFEAWPARAARRPRRVPARRRRGLASAMRSKRRRRELRIAHRVVFTGRRDDVPAVTAALDVAVLPSYREAQGLSILEAMALSRPVVASNVGGIPEMIEDGVTGLLVEPHDAEAPRPAIIRLLSDHPYADTLARAGPRPRPRPVLHRADGRGGRGDLRGGRPNGPRPGGGGRLGERRRSRGVVDARAAWPRPGPRRGSADLSPPSRRGVRPRVSGR